MYNITGTSTDSLSWHSSFGVLLLQGLRLAHLLLPGLLAALRRLGRLLLAFAALPAAAGLACLWMPLPASPSWSLSLASHPLQAPSARIAWQLASCCIRTACFLLLRSLLALVLHSSVHLARLAFGRLLFLGACRAAGTACRFSWLLLGGLLLVRLPLALVILACLACGWLLFYRTPRAAGTACRFGCFAFCS